MKKKKHAERRRGGRQHCRRCFCSAEKRETTHVFSILLYYFGPSARDDGDMMENVSQCKGGLIEAHKIGFKEKTSDV